MPRYDLAAVTLGEHLYALGGETPAGVLGAAERYAPGGAGWEALAPLPTPRCALAAAALGRFVRPQLLLNPQLLRTGG